MKTGPADVDPVVARHDPGFVDSRTPGLANLLFGRPLRTDEEVGERLTRPRALAVFASDALSSVAYATESMLLVLVPVAGAAAYGAALPLSAGVAGVLALLVASYRQTVKAYPNAGGAYVVTRDNFGLLPAQVAGMALLTDYVLTVSVSVAAGVAAVYSAVPAVFPWRVPLAVALIWLVAAVNLRGIRASGRVFAAPTYVFVLSVLVVLVVGGLRGLAGDLPHGEAGAVDVTGPLTLAVLLHAFASGSTAMTGVEAVSNGVSAFRPVEWRNARTVLLWMGVLLAVMFLGISWMASVVRPPVGGQETVLSEVARAALGAGSLAAAGFAVVQGATAAILVLAANTSFADFPRLASFHAHDHFLPEGLRYRGRRLAFSNGILVLAVLSSVLVAVVGARVDRLIPLYAVGVFTSFTCSQAGMAKHHLRLREAGWRRGLAINALGATASGVVLVVVAVTKFSHGAWIVLLLIPAGVGVAVGVHRHYLRVAAALGAATAGGSGPADLSATTVSVRDLDRLDRLFTRSPSAWATVWAPGGGVHPAGPHEVVVLAGELLEPARSSLAVARRLGAQRLSALHVVEHLDEDPEGVGVAWREAVPDVPLTVVAAPWREVVGPTLEHVRGLLARRAGRVTVVLGWVVSPRWWMRRLHNRRSRPLAAALAREPGVSVVVVPQRLATSTRRS